MLISLNWLKQYIDLDGIEINEMENALTMIGQEVEKIEIAGSNLENVVTAKIIEKEMHPDSETRASSATSSTSSCASAAEIRSLSPLCAKNAR